MRKLLVVTLALLFLSALTVSGVYAAQGGNSSLGGTVSDTSKALIPGVLVTLTNTDTGVMDTRLTNDSGTFQFPSIQPGNYKIEAGLKGFKTTIKTGNLVGAATQVRVDLTLTVGTGGETVSVNVPNESRINETSASVGEVLSGERARDLPNVGGNVLDLLTVLPGFRTSLFGAAFDTVGGMALDTVHATINGVSSNDSRIAASNAGYQVYSPIVINPDLVGEIRLILAPVDAELGGGNAQVQIQTRSGTNKYTGTGVWNIQNSAMDANTWTNNHTPTVVAGIVTSGRTTPPWQNRNQLTGSFGGPILKNKTFFFVLLDDQMTNSRALATNTVYTESAKQGIWKFFPGWNPQNAAPNNTVTACAATAPATGVFTGNQPSVDVFGNPLASVPNALCGGAPVTLECYSVFGNQKFDYKNNAMVPFTDADCPGGTRIPFTPSATDKALTTWDDLRPGADSTGYISKILKLMPSANTWSVLNTGDGLNTAGNQFLRGKSGSNSANAAFGAAYSSADQTNRKQLNVKIDHNFNSKNRVSVQYSYQWTSGIGFSFAGSQAAAWEQGFQGAQKSTPQVWTVNGTSTLSQNMVNESRFGLSTTVNRDNPAWANPLDPATALLAQGYIPKVVPGNAAASDILNGVAAPGAYPVVFNPGATAGGFMQFAPQDASNNNPNWDFADTLRWTHAKHSFSFGGEYRRQITTGWNVSPYETAGPGNNPGAAAQNLGLTTQFLTQLPFLNAGTRGSSVTLLNLLSGSLASASTGYWVNSFSDINIGHWTDTTTAVDKGVQTGDPYNYGHQTLKQVSNVWSGFVKDDYKILRHLTLNLGLRYDINMSPYLGNGLTNRLANDAVGLYGPAVPTSGDFLSKYMVPGDSATGLFLAGYGTTGAVGGPQCSTGFVNAPGIPTSNCDPSLVSKLIFVGPGTPNPSQTLVPQKGRFSPAVGFAWQVPFFGEGKTTVRGGWQRTYGGGGPGFPLGLTSGVGVGGLGNASLSAADLITTGGVNPANPGRALTLADLPNLIGRTPTAPPSAPLPLIAVNGGTAITYSDYAPGYVTPYTDNLTLSVTRNIARNYTLDVRFVDTLGKKQSGGAGAFGSAGSIDLNQPNVYNNPELMQALVNTRDGKNDPLLDQMLFGLNLNTAVAGYGPVGTCVTQVVTATAPLSPLAGVGCPAGQVLQRGSQQLRRVAAGNLANGDFVDVVNLLTASATAANGYTVLPSGVSGQRERILRNGCDRLANTSGGVVTNLNTGGTNITSFAATDVNGNPITITPRCFAENYIISNPALGQAELSENFGRSNYQSAQLQFTARPVQGISIQGTYSYSKTMALPGNGYTNPLNRQIDYGLSQSNIGSEFRSNATIELPLGPNKLLFGNSSGWFARAIEKWQTSFIYVMPQGTVRSLGTVNMLYANGRPSIVNNWVNPKGEVSWTGNTGQFFGTVANPTYALYTDNQCLDANYVSLPSTSTDPGTFSLAGSCTLRGLGYLQPAGSAGTVVNGAGQTVLPLLANPLPGQQGNLGPQTMHTISRWSLDANASKRFRISESKALQFRIDTTNVLNHPLVGDPTGVAGGNSLVAGTTFGALTTKSGNRSFQASLRLTF